MKNAIKERLIKFKSIGKLITHQEKWTKNDTLPWTAGWTRADAAHVFLSSRRHPRLLIHLMICFCSFKMKTASFFQF